MQDWISARGAKVVPGTVLKTLSTRSDLRGLTQLFSQIAAVAAAIICMILLAPSAWTILPFIVLGIMLNCLYAGQHEMSHRTAFRSRWLNDGVGAAIGFLSIYPARWDRYFHFAHHRHTQDPARDPELLARGPYTPRSYALYFIGLTYWYGRMRSTLRIACGRLPAYATYLLPAQRSEVIAEARWHLAGYAAVLALSLVLHTWAAVLFWLAPMMLLKWVHNLQNTGEHTCLTHEQDTLRNTRTLRGPKLVRWLVWNMSYHTAHHTFPGIPFFALPALNTEIQTRLGESLPGASYIGAQIDIATTLLRDGDRMGDLA
ncbi:fatty acid desaturase [Acidisoma cellulosilytica]|uniref:Fatty acid desaturase n=1 Tax=Acidisoma cellulosilyticum TaxID=2802395 RepID=A0A963Z3J8_9PROT|nr:fatty acid desaturase [Acidisoma cellulosilyticum]MCB8882109.1 fatty acid desaturase [Acidisoma cellulosilyticum]